MDSAGVALLGTSLITGLSAKSKEDRLARECDAGQVCDPSLASVKDGADTLALVTDVLWISGAVAAGVGGYRIEGLDQRLVYPALEAGTLVQGDVPGNAGVILTNLFRIEKVAATRDVLAINLTESVDSSEALWRGFPKGWGRVIEYTPGIFKK